MKNLVKLLFFCYLLLGVANSNFVYSQIFNLYYDDFDQQFSMSKSQEKDPPMDGISFYGGYMFSLIHIKEKQPHFATNVPITSKSSASSSDTFSFGIIYEKYRSEYSKYIFGIMNYYGSFEFTFDYTFSRSFSDKRYRHSIDVVYLLSPIFGYKFISKKNSNVDFVVGVGLKTKSKISNEYLSYRSSTSWEYDQAMKDVHPIYFFGELNISIGDGALINISLHPAIYNFVLHHDETFMIEGDIFKARVFPITLGLNL